MHAPEQGAQVCQMDPNNTAEVEAGSLSFGTVTGLLVENTDSLGSQIAMDKVNDEILDAQIALEEEIASFEAQKVRSCLRRCDISFSF